MGARNSRDLRLPYIAAWVIGVIRLEKGVDDKGNVAKGWLGICRGWLAGGMRGCNDFDVTNALDPGLRRDDGAMGCGSVIGGGVSDWCDERFSKKRSVGVARVGYSLFHTMKCRVDKSHETVRGKRYADG